MQGLIEENSLIHLIGSTKKDEDSGDIVVHSINQWIFVADGSKAKFTVNYYLSNHGADSLELHRKYLEVLCNQSKVGLVVEVLCSDAGPANRSFISKIADSREPLETTSLPKGCVTSTHPFLDDKLIYLMLCAVHGLKAIRNVLVSSTYPIFPSKRMLSFILYIEHSLILSDCDRTRVLYLLTTFVCLEKLDT